MHTKLAGEIYVADSSSKPRAGRPIGIPREIFEGVPRYSRLPRGIETTLDSKRCLGAGSAPRNFF